MAQSTQQRLAGYQRRYRELAAELADLGYIAAGSITQRSTRCGTPSCRCHADPPQLHGPYWQWTAKVNGKTVTRRLVSDNPRSPWFEGGCSLKAGRDYAVCPGRGKNAIGRVRTGTRFTVYGPAGDAT